MQVLDELINTLDGLNNIGNVGNSHTADKPIKCTHCGKIISKNPDALIYPNGTAFCNKECEEDYERHIKYGNQIYDAVRDYIPLGYLKTDINRLKSETKYPNRIDSIVNWKFGQKGLAIIGDTGCGKTRALSLLLRRLIEKDLFGVEYTLKVFYAGELERAIMSSFANKAKSYEDLMRSLETCKLLVIDDFGKERLTERYEVSIFQIFEKRTANLRPTIITTNYKGADLRARFSDQNNYDPFSRRLNEFCDRIVLSKK